MKNQTKSNKDLTKKDLIKILKKMDLESRKQNLKRILQPRKSLNIKGVNAPDYD